MVRHRSFRWARWTVVVLSDGIISGNGGLELVHLLTLEILHGSEVTFHKRHDRVGHVCGRLK